MNTASQKIYITSSKQNLNFTSDDSIASQTTIIYCDKINFSPTITLPHYQTVGTTIVYHLSNQQPIGGQNMVVKSPVINNNQMDFRGKSSHIENPTTLNVPPNETSKYCDFNRIYASGKSDGGGFCFYLLESSSIKLNKIATCSAAHFTLDSTKNTAFLSNKIQSVPILAIHGTGDTVMPYGGQHFLNQNATKQAEYWKKIDPTLTNTYTFQIPYLWNYIGKLFDKTTKSSVTNFPNNSTLTSWGSVNLIAAKKQDHCWMGHENSGPNSNESSNKYFDATTLICSFFDNIPLSNYTNSVTTPKIMFNSIT